MKRTAMAQLRALVAALAVLGVSIMASVALNRISSARDIERTIADAQAGALRGMDALRALLSGFESQMQLASSNPRLVAALGAGIDQQTLRDLLLNEEWWEPFRSKVEGFGLVRRGDEPEVSVRLPENFDFSLLRARTRSGKPASELRVVGGQVLALAACAVTLPGRRESALLLATKIVDVGTLALVAERVAGAAAISDGRHVLVGAGGTGAGAPVDVVEIRRHPSMAASEVLPLGGARDALAALPITGELRLIVHVRRTGAPPITVAGKPWSVWAPLVMGIAAAIGIYLRLRRRSSRTTVAPVPVDHTMPSVVTSVGRYRMLERIGLGGMVETYSAVTTGEGGFRRSVVIKRLLPQLADDPVAVAQFCGEANLLAALHHPNIVAVQDFGRAGDQLFLAEEYILGRDLGQLVKRNLERQRRALAPEVAAHVCFEVLKALDYVHSLRNEQERPLGIVHGDISPENIMISWRGEVKLLDIGVGKLNDGTPSPSEPSVIKGSATFKSPEQARGVNDDARSDLYATALIMYYCLAGKPLYESDTGYGLLLKAAAGPGPEEWAAVARLPARLSMILRRAWAPRMENRYQTAREMAASLENLIGDGAQQTQTLLEQLFGKELIAEERRLAEAPIEPSHREIMLT